MAPRKLFALSLLISIVGLASAALSAPIASGDLIAVTGSSCCSSSPSDFPNVYQLDSTGSFKRFWFSPFAPSDIAVDKAGHVLFGSTGSGNIVMTDTSGSFLGFINSPVPQVNGLGVASDGSLIVASGNSIYHLDAQGHFLSLTFSPISFSGNASIGVLGDNTVVFADPNNNGCCGSTPEKLDLFNIDTRVMTQVTTPLTSISALDVSETGDFWVAGSTSGFNPFNPSNTIFELDPTGKEITSIIGPQNISALAIANLPEPNVGLLVGVGFSMLAIKRKREIRALERGSDRSSWHRSTD